MRASYCWEKWYKSDKLSIDHILLIFDGVVEYEELEKYLPPVKYKYKIIITTRQQTNLIPSQVPVGELDIEDAIDLFVNLTSDDDIEWFRKTSKKVHNIPLAIHQISAALQRRGL